MSRIMKATTGYDYSRPGELVTSGDEAMVKAWDNGEVLFHPDLIAYGTTELGWLTVPGWQGSMLYQRGFCNLGGVVCVGDAVCEAIERGGIPLRPIGELPNHLRASRLLSTEEQR